MVGLKLWYVRLMNDQEKVPPPADESSLSKCSTVEARHRMRAACAGAAPPGWREAPRDPSDSDDNSDSAANTTTKGTLLVSPCISAHNILQLTETESY